MYWSAVISLSGAKRTPRKKSIADRSRPFVISSPAAPRELQKRVDRKGSAQPSSVFLNMVKISSLFLVVIAVSMSSRSFAVEQPSDIPAWLRPNVGEGEGQIAQVVCKGRARFISKKCARAWLEIPAILPWTLRVPTI